MLRDAAMDACRAPTRREISHDGRRFHFAYTGRARRSRFSRAISPRRRYSMISLAATGCSAHVYATARRRLNFVAISHSFTIFHGQQVYFLTHHGDSLPLRPCRDKFLAAICSEFRDGAIRYDFTAASRMTERAAAFRGLLPRS